MTKSNGTVSVGSTAMVYGHRELAYAEPLAHLLEKGPKFVEWILSNTAFADLAAGGRLLADEMRNARSRRSRFWWRSHFTMSCKCDGCSGGRETDMLAVIELSDNSRLAIHCEIKHPLDRLHPGQAHRYSQRASCWVECPPSSVVPHNNACTILFCGERSRLAYGTDVLLFDAVITWEQVAEEFPGLLISKTSA